MNEGQSLGLSLVVCAAAALVVAAAPGAAPPRPVTIWGAVSGFYGTRTWKVLDVCQARYLGNRLALVRARIRGTKHYVVLRLVSAKRGWMVTWADGRVNRKVRSSERTRVSADVTRLKVRCLAP